MKFLEAGIAAGAGSEEAALFLSETSQRTDVRSIQSLRDALLQIYSNYEGLPNGPPRGQPPKWLNELALVIVSDNRPVTHLPNGGWTRDMTFAVAAYSKDLLTALVYFRYPGVLPLLEQRIQKDDADWRAWQDLAKFDEQRAVAGLIKAFKKSVAVWTHGSEGVVDADFMDCAWARLRSKPAQPFPFSWSISNIRTSLDASQKSATRALCRHSTTWSPPAANSCETASRPNPSLTPRDGLRRGSPGPAVRSPQRSPTAGRPAHRPQTTAPLRRRHAAGKIGRSARDAPPGQGDQDGHRPLYSRHGHRALGDAKERAAVQGLIDGFDVAFRSEDLGKGSHATPATYRNRIAASLQQITGQQFGADKQQWLEWWHEKGHGSTNLK